MLLWVGCPPIFNWIINNSPTQQVPSSHFLNMYLASSLPSKINQGVTMLKTRQCFMIYEYVELFLPSGYLVGKICQVKFTVTTT